MNRHIAAIDAGTNSFHMIIARVDPGNSTLDIIDREKEMIRLGSGSANMKFISGESMSKAVDTLKKFKKICTAKNASIRAVGTSVVREALNSDFFLKKVKVETGIDIEVISGFEEARLIYQGVLHALPVYNKKILVVDIGGGSTEFLVGQKNNIFYGNSLKIGTVRLTEKFFSERKFKRKAIKKCRNFVKGMLFPIARAVKKMKYDEVIGTSGTIINALRVARRLAGRYEQGNENNTLTRKEFETVYEIILSAGTPEKIAEIPGLNKKRADIILAGIIILGEIFRQFDIEELKVSEYALREGLIFDTMQRAYPGKYSHMFVDLRYKSVTTLGRTFRLEEKHAFQTEKLALEIFDQLKPLHKLKHAEREYLRYAAILHDIGLVLSHSQHHIHSYYIIRNAELFGFTENEKEIIANISRYHRKSHPKMKHPGFLNLSDTDRDKVKKLSAILRIADGLDRMHSSAIEFVRCIIRRNSVNMMLKYSSKSNIDIAIWGADVKKFLFEEVYGKKVNFEKAG